MRHNVTGYMSFIRPSMAGCRPRVRHSAMGLTNCVRHSLIGYSDFIRHGMTGCTSGIYSGKVGTATCPPCWATKFKKIYHIYSNARWGFFLKFGAQICAVILNLRMKHQTALHQTRLLWTCSGLHRQIVMWDLCFS